MRDRFWLAWSGGRLLAFAVAIVLVNAGIAALFAGHGQAVTALGRVITIALSLGGLYVIVTWARNRDQSRSAKP